MHELYFIINVKKILNGLFFENFIEKPRFLNCFEYFICFFHMLLSILAVSDAQCHDIIYNGYNVLNKDESVCFNVSAFIQINGNNTIVQKKGEATERTFINKTNIFSIQLDGSLSTTITCTDSSGKCSYRAFIIKRSLPLNSEKVIPLSLIK